MQSDSLFPHISEGHREEDAEELNDGRKDNMYDGQEKDSTKENRSSVEHLKAGGKKNSSAYDAGGSCIDDDEDDDGNKSEEDEANVKEVQKEYERRAEIRVGKSSTCMQIEDLDEAVFSIAPGQNSFPKYILMDHDFEVLSFPDFFPGGFGGFEVKMKISN